MLGNEVTRLLNDQVNKEFYSSYFYFGMADYYIANNLNGFGNWFTVQAQEERDHALLFVKYIQNNSADLVLNDIKVAPLAFNDFSEPLAETLKHEIFVTKSINDIYSAAIADKDYRTTQFLDWFIKEQGEEEKNSDELIKKYELFGKDGKGLYLLDSELAARVYAPPTLVI